jgi:hypothetical protein
VNGTLAAGPTDTTSGNSLGTGYDRLGAGYASGSLGDFFTGSIAVLQMYNTTLTAQQIKQNCLAQQGRFGSTSCASP